VPYSLNRIPTYRFSVQELGRIARVQLRLAERVIRTRADRLPNSISVQLGGRPVTLFGFGDLRIYLAVHEAAAVSLYLVVDSADLPDWFVFPTGTWSRIST
jgi:hypothetical protein